MAGLVVSLSLSLLSEELKQAKQHFVSGLTGTTLSEVALLGCVLPLCFAFRYAVLHLLASRSAFPSSLARPASAVRAAVCDAAVFSCCVVVPATLSLTALSSHTPALLLALLLASLAALQLSAGPRPAATTGGDTSAGVSPTLFVSLYRCGLLLSTSIAILGVDFAVFPRRLGKTEAWGVSPMDAGVGGFMFAAALTSPAARGQRGVSLAASVRRQLPVALLGCLRLAAVKSANYQEHVTEYGVHWNFFFTLAAVSVVCDTACRALSLRLCGLLGLALLCAYQLSLSRLGLSSYILHAPRHSLLAANREGVASVVGYVALYLLALQLAAPMMAQAGKWSSLRRKAACFTVSCALLHAACDAWVQPVSRRLLNASYVLWQLWLNALVLLAFVLVQAALLPSGSPRAPRAALLSPDSVECRLSRRGLPFFLLSNACTGLVNVSVDTMAVGDSAAVCVLTAYMHACVAATYLYDYGRGGEAKRHKKPLVQSERSRHD